MNIAKAGSLDTKTRSDCEVQIELKQSGGINIDLKSKVDVMFGKANRQLINDVLKHFEIENANITITDKGALPFVIAARIEAAIVQLLKTEKSYLLDVIEPNKTITKKDQFRFSRLYLPGNSPSMMLNAGVHNPNGVILDLEDAVAPDKKHEARYIVRNALRSVNFYGAERMVRINQGEKGLEDLEYIAAHNVNLILIPKCESAEEIRKIDKKIDELRKKHNFDYPIWYMPIIESAMGVEKAFEIATASKNVSSMAIGLEDFTADLGVRRTNEATESLYARTRIVNACKAARIQPIDSVFSDVSDMEGLAKNVQTSKSLGFEGMGCIHPRQIQVIMENFAPETVEIEKAQKIVRAFNEAKEKGLGVVSLGTKMIDAPVVKRAETTINLAIKLGLLEENWIKN
ncbi:MAG: citrate lyase acyl carrier protein [Bacteroidales bacterium]|nr:citrate lyase acyl carrier protein [Bacteroidales bacterium]